MKRNMYYLKDIVSGIFKEGYMKIIKLTDQPDGSAIAEIDMTQEEIDFFVEYAFNDIIRKGMERMENETDIRTPVSNS
jgi:hypothetical protein